MVEKIFIIGATGKVGKELVSQILAKDTNGMKHKNPTTIVGLASGSSFIYDREGLSAKSALSFASRSTNGERYSKLFEIADLLEKSNDVVRIVDVTPSENITDFHLRVIRKSKNTIVTANKNPLVLSDYKTFEALTSKTQRYNFRCSVMAGAEAVDKIRDLRDLEDLPVSIEGCFSGTLGFVLSELEAGRRFSEAVREAVRRGYTEPHPGADLDGSDVAKKILILARTAGYAFDLNDVELSPFIPKEYLNENDINSFIERLAGLDSQFKSETETARREGKRLRYIARFTKTGNRPQISTALEAVDAESPIGRLTGILNKIVVRTKTYGDYFYSVEAPGAGVEITAQNVRRDLLVQIQDREIASQ